MLHEKYITIEELKNSIKKDEYQYLYKEDKELKGNKTHENETIIENAKDFMTYKWK